MYCCCNARRSGSRISAGVRTCAETAPLATTIRIRATSRHVRRRQILAAAITVRSGDIPLMHLLFLRRVKRKVQVRIRYLIFAQIVEYRHSAAKWLCRRSHADRIAEGDFSNKVRQVRPSSERTKRWYRTFQDLLGVG